MGMKIDQSSESREIMKGFLNPFVVLMGKEVNREV